MYVIAAKEKKKNITDCEEGLNKFNTLFALKPFKQTKLNIILFVSLIYSQWYVFVFSR